MLIAANWLLTDRPGLALTVLEVHGTRTRGDTVLTITPAMHQMMARPSQLRSASVQSPMETYLRGISKTPLLSAAQEKQLANRIGAGDNVARNLMVLANLRLVVYIARGYTGKGLDLEDLIEEGNLGLLRAVEGFDPNRNTRFSTYGNYWIRQSIKRGLVNTAKAIRIPVHMVELLAKWRRTCTKLQDELCRQPTQEEIALSLGLSRKKLHIINRARRIDIVVPQSDLAEGGRSIDDMLMDGWAKPPDSGIAEPTDLKHMLDVLGRMDPREAAVLRMRFGIETDEPKTLKQIGESLGLTRERVRQIQSEALHKLRQSLSSD